MARIALCIREPLQGARTFPVTTALPRIALPRGLLWIVNERDGDITAVWTYTVKGVVVASMKCGTSDRRVPWP